MRLQPATPPISFHHLDHTLNLRMTLFESHENFALENGSALFKVFLGNFRLIFALHSCNSNLRKQTTRMTLQLYEWTIHYTKNLSRATNIRQCFSRVNAKSWFFFFEMSRMGEIISGSKRSEIEFVHLLCLTLFGEKSEYSFKERLSNHKKRLLQPEITKVKFNFKARKYATPFTCTVIRFFFFIFSFKLIFSPHNSPPQRSFVEKK